jgi:hypothetical protein
VTEETTTPQHGPTPPGPSPNGPAAGAPRSGRPASRFSRRQLLAGTGGGLGALVVGGLAGFELPHNTASASSTGASTTTPTTQPTAAPAGPSSSVQSFITRPDLQPPSVTLTAYGPSTAGAPPFIFLSPRNYIAGAPGQAGLMIIDRQGRLVWFKPTTAAPFDFNAQSYQGKPVLTWWQGDLIYDYGSGTGEIADASYITRRSVQAGGGLREDLHELVLTSAGTALITAYQTIEADLSSVGGKTKAQVVNGHAQEIDLATGKLLFDWDCWDHIGADESYVDPPASGPYDYFHINSIAETSDGNLLISAKNTCAVYKVDRSSGKVLWRMNGKKTDFTMGPGSPFFYQHHARPNGLSGISVFDDGYEPNPKAPSRGLLLDVDEKAMRVSVSAAYRHPAGFVSGSQGSVQVLPDGHVFVGWGNQSYFSEFAADGTLVLDGELPIGCHSYRAFCNDWAGMPSGAPAIAVRSNPAGGSVVYASWNGAVNVARWSVLAGSEESSLTAIGSQQWGGFETAIAVNSGAGYYAVAALDASGKVLGRSATTRA